jgi:hypothetical protein
MRLSLFGANNANECIMAVASLAIVSGFSQGNESTGNSQQTRKLNLRQAQLRSDVFEALHVVSGFSIFYKLLTRKVLTENEDKLD